MLLEEMVEVSWFLKTEAIAYLCYVPVCMLKQNLCLTCQSVKNMIAGSFAGSRSYGTVQVIHMNGKVISKILSGTECESLCW